MRTQTAQDGPLTGLRLQPAPHRLVVLTALHVRLSGESKQHILQARGLGDSVDGGGVSCGFGHLYISPFVGRSERYLILVREVFEAEGKSLSIYDDVTPGI